MRKSAAWDYTPHTALERLTVSAIQISCDVTGCQAMRRVLVWGARGRTFEPCHSDHSDVAGFRIS